MIVRIASPGEVGGQQFRRVSGIGGVAIYSMLSLCTVVSFDRSTEKMMVLSAKLSLQLFLLEDRSKPTFPGRMEHILLEG